jgi:hypothetical protein
MCRLLAIVLSIPCFLFASAEAEARAPLGPVLFNRARSVGPVSSGIHYRRAIRPFGATHHAPGVHTRRHGYHRVYTPTPQHGTYYRSYRPSVLSSTPQGSTTYRVIPRRR